MSKITFGGGCFWCIEGIFRELKGVKKAISGYTGGKSKNPTYKEVCSGKSGHVEVVQLTYDEKIISDYSIIKAFMLMHDPTTLNRQGNDIGTQYRSVIYYHNDLQKINSFKVFDELNKEVYNGKIVTKVEKIEHFFEAEEYHQNYYFRNPDLGYSQYVITPKLEKFKKLFLNKLKEK